MKTKVNLLLLLMLVISMLVPGLGLASNLSYGSGIVVDGLTADWDLEEDFYADMYNAGNPDENWPGFAILAKLYLRYDCNTETLCALVLDVPGDGQAPGMDCDESWIKIYGLGWAGDKFIDGNGDGNTFPREFQWVIGPSGDNDCPLIGFEASGQLVEALYQDFECHMNVGGDTASTGKHAQGNAIQLNVTCDGQPVFAEERPLGFNLEQNHPNPFNPVTQIAYSLADHAVVKLSVMDLAGRQVARLAEGLQSRGSHSVRFDASQLASGVYLSVLEANGHTQSRKMLLVK